MATTISNPASFSSVRTAFNAEGYGISSSFFAYRQGGGIVPATSGFNAIGAGSGGDPLQLSQFNGFVVPSQGVTITTGSTATIVSAGKGTAGHSLFSHGLSPGSSTSGNYVDTDAFYSIGYAPIGSYSSGNFNGFVPVETVWHSFSSEDAELGYYEYKLRIVVTGNIGGASGGAGSTGTAFTPYVNGTAIAGAKAGVWGGAPGEGGTGQTVFTWIRGVRPNSSQAEIPGSDNTLVTSNPFGSNGSTPLITLL